MLCQLSYGAEIHDAAEKINKKQQTNVILFDNRAVVDCRLRAKGTILVSFDWVSMESPQRLQSPSIT